MENINVREKRRFWSFLTKLKEDPQKFFEDDKNKNVKNMSKQNFQYKNFDIKQKLEASKTSNNTALRIIHRQLNTTEYLSMNKNQRDCHLDGNIYDEHGYLITKPMNDALKEKPGLNKETKNCQKVSNYKSVPLKNAGAVTSSENKNSETPICKRKPMVLPRNSTDERGYLQGPALPNMVYNNTENTFPRTRRNQKCKLTDSTVIDSISPDESETLQFDKKMISLYNKEDEKVIYNIPTYAESFEHDTHSQKTGRLLLNEDLGMNIQNCKMPNMKQTGNSDDSLDKVSSDSFIKKGDIKKRPLPPAPSRRTLIDVPSQQFSKIADKVNNTKNSDKCYVNNDIILTVPTNYNDTMFWQNLGTKRRTHFLPSPPKFFPHIPLDPIINMYNDNGYDACEILNINNNPYYRYTDRTGAEQTLSNLEDGAFLFRPSKKYFLTLSIKFKKHIFHLNIERTETNKIRIITKNEVVTSPEFVTIKQFISYFTKEPLTFQHDGNLTIIYLNEVLPPD